MNGDGRDDLVWHKPGGDEDNLFFVGLGGQTGTFRVGEQQAVKARGRWSDLSLLDVSGDGAADMVFNSICQARDAGRCTAGRNLLTIGQVDASGGAVFADEQELPAADLERLGLQIRHPAADYNGDGAEDLLWSSMSVHFLGGSSVNTLLAGLALPGEYVSYIPVAMKP